jgi:tetratricopeptide (TPR) repeat protein
MLEKPTAVAPKIDYLRAIANSGEKEKAKEELFKLYETNKNDEKALLAISHYATETAELELMRKIYDTSIRNGFNTSQFCMMLLETFISCKKYQEAVDFSQAIIAEDPKWLNKNEDVFMCLRAVSYYAVGNMNMAEALVENVIKRKTINPRNMVATARRFALLGENSMAHKMYLSAVERDPKHQYALVRLIQFEIDSGNSSDLGKYILRLINLRRPPRDMILKARTALLSDRFIYTDDREKVISSIDAIFDIEKVSSNRILSDLPSDYEDEKIFSSF